MGSSSSKAGAGAGSRRPRSDTSRSRSSSSSSCSSSCLESDGDASISKHNNNKEEENLNHYGDDDDRTADRPTTTTTTTTTTIEEEEEANDNKQNQGFFCSNSRRGGDDLCSSQSASTSLRSRFSFNFKLTRASTSNAPAPAPAPQVISYQDIHNRFSRALSVDTQSPPTLSNSMHTGQDDHSPPREARYHHLMDHTTDFLQRRRRIRSQVRALQRLGSRFENLSGHERACILAGQHRSGFCTCRMSNRARNPDDNTSARASISRIVMLAEALFEVLDEIHQQSVVLSSRPSLSSLGSIPAPKEVVESLPVKIYTKLQKHQIDDVPQCYICLIEYEEGDTMRILPCHHEFHRPCIDKWLKEIHRVCPLCRGDVCRSE